MKHKSHKYTDHKEDDSLQEKVKMDENNKETIIQELTLVLISLTGWEEDKRSAPGQKVFRAWKGYKFEQLEKLQDQRFIYQIPGGKSLVLYEKGKEKARELMKKYIKGE